VLHAFRECVQPFREYYTEPLDFIGVGDQVVVRHLEQALEAARLSG
jgi:hypothetical protein